MGRRSLLGLATGTGLALALGLLAGIVLARGGTEAPGLTETAPSVISYQGEVLVDGKPYNGTGYFKFAFVNLTGDATLWSNDGSSTAGNEPTTAEALAVEDGLFAVLLGNQAPPYSMPALTAAVFADRGRRLHVWFDPDGSGAFTDLGLTVIAAVPYALNAETLDGQDGSYYDQHYAHVLVVAASGGDFTTVGAALADITDNGPDSRYLVWVAPGTYMESVTMKEYVDIEGAGELLTTITFEGSESLSTGTVVGADNAELRFVTVRNTGGHWYAVAIFSSYASPRLTHVTASASGALSQTQGVSNLHSDSAMTHVTVLASGSERAYGVWNSSSSPTMVNVNALASGGESAYGVYDSSSSPTMVGLAASATDCVLCYGVYNYYSSPAIRASTLSAHGSGSSYGLYNVSASGGYTVTVDNCQIEGDTGAVLNGSGNTTYVGGSRLDGAVSGNGAEVCVYSYDATYAALDSNCQ